MNLLIIGGRVIDPANHRDGIYDVLIEEGKIKKIGKNIPCPKNVSVLSAKGMWVMPGFIDAHVHFREPGGERSETIESGSRSAAKGGVTTVFMMANTKPPADSPRIVRSMVQRAKDSAIVKVCSVGTVSKRLEGNSLTNLRSLKKAGCKAFSDDGRCVMDSQLFQEALKICKKTNAPLLEHCEDESLSGAGVMNEGEISHRLGFVGISNESEFQIVKRDIECVEKTGAPAHLQHISTKESVNFIREAKRKKVPVTAETCPHYFSLTEKAVLKFGSNAKMKPPLRTKEDVEAVKKGLQDGTIDLIVTDHAPHIHKSGFPLPLRERIKVRGKEFEKAPFGIIGLETSFALVYNELILKKFLTPLEAVRKMTFNPAKVFHLEEGNLSVRSPADIAIFDPTKEWIYSKEEIVSKSCNSPFIGRKFKGKIVATIVDGCVVYEDGKFFE